jgi:hypothetical protein
MIPEYLRPVFNDLRGLEEPAASADATIVHVAG